MFASLKTRSASALVTTGFAVSLLLGGAGTGNAEPSATDQDVTQAGVGSAAHDDGFTVSTKSGGCGAVDFVDYGPGAPGGGNNDDYLVIHDYCADGLGVRAEAWVSGSYRGSKYNGNGLAGAAVIWDPFSGIWNIAGGDIIGVRVCLVNGAGDTTPTKCHNVDRTSVDG